MFKKSHRLMSTNTRQKGLRSNDKMGRGRRMAHRCAAIATVGCLLPNVLFPQKSEEIKFSHQEEELLTVVRPISVMI